MHSDVLIVREVIQGTFVIKLSYYKIEDIREKQVVSARSYSTGRIEVQ